MTDISELFDRNPLLLSDEDITAIVTKLREMRASFNVGAKPATKPATKPKAKILDVEIDL